MTIPEPKKVIAKCDLCNHIIHEGEYVVDGGAITIDISTGLGHPLLFCSDDCYYCYFDDDDEDDNSGADEYDWL